MGIQLLSYICFLKTPISGKQVSGKGAQIRKCVQINDGVFLFLDNQQKQGVHMGIHQGPAGCLVGMGGDVAHWPAGRYVDRCAVLMLA